ncbi:MAG: cytidylate kinase-like family protein, partial [Gemmatimonadota bacterium]
WSVVDNEFIEAVSRKAGMPREEVAEREERGPSFGERLVQVLAASPEVPLVPAAPTENPDEPTLVKATETVVVEIARMGRAVLVGRAAVAVLGRHPDAVHVLLVAPEPFRAKVLMERLGLEEKTALKAIHDTDNQRARYHRKYYQRDWLDPVNYHMVLNTEPLGFDGAATLIVNRAKSLGWG